MLSKKLGRLIVLVGLVLSVGVLLPGCDSVNSQEVDSTIKPVKLSKVPNINQQHTDSFIGKTDATERAVLSFNVAGEIDSKMVRMGRQVKKGEVLAYLDPTDYQLTLDARQAEFDLAKTQYLRAKALFAESLISTDQFEQNDTNLKVASAQLEQAKTDLTYSKITAPFDGIVSLTMAESHQVVGAKQPIVKLLNNTVMDVIFTLPISYVEKYGIDKISQSRLSVTMDAKRSLMIPAQFKEISTQPNKDTNSYTARVTIKRPQDLTLLTDMSGQVHLLNQEESRLFRLPETAWISRNDQQGRVWKFDKTEHSLTQVLVMLDSHGFVQGGLAQGDLVVQTGIENLREGQRVKAWIEEDGI